MNWSTVRKFLAAWGGVLIGHVSAGTGAAYRTKLLDRMKSPTASDDYTEPATQDNASRGPSLRYLIVSNVKITLLGALIFIILWVALELLFPRLVRAESTMAQAAGAVAEGATYPLATTIISMDRDKGGTVKWTVRPRGTSLTPPDCRIEAAESVGVAVNAPPGVDFEFVYGDAVEFYQETLAVKIARILDIVRAPEAAMDQMGMKLYDVDALPAHGYKMLLEGVEPTQQPGAMSAGGEESEQRHQPILAFVTAADTTPPMETSSWHELAGKAGEFDFIGAPVQWNIGVEDLLRYKAAEPGLAEMFECAGVSPTNLVKGAMHAVIASAEGMITEDTTMDADWLAASEDTKMYLAVMSRAIALENEIEGLDPIRTVSFRSAWDEALGQQWQAGIKEEAQESIE